MCYIHPNKRLELSILHPKLRKLEKSVPLNLERLEFTLSSIIINFAEYIFKREKKKIGCYDRGCCEVTILRANSYSKLISDSIGVVASALFNERPNLRVKRFNYHADLSLRLNLHVENIKIGLTQQCSARDYCNVVQDVDNLLFLELSDISELRHPWVRNAKRLEKVHGNNAFFLEEIPNLLAKEICIHSDNDPVDSLDLIRVWCQNRDRKVGSKLLLTFHTTQEETIISRVFSSRQLAEIGFFSVSHEISCLRLENDSKLRLTVQEGKVDVSLDYWLNARFQRHLCLEVVSS